MFACCGVTMMGKHWHAASNNGCHGVALGDEVGVYVFESLSQDLNSSSDSDDEVSHVSAESGSVISHSEYESAVKNFGALENQWLNEPDSLQQQTLYKSIFEAEVAFAVKFGNLFSPHYGQSKGGVSCQRQNTQSNANTAQEQMLHWSASARTCCEKRKTKKSCSNAYRS